MGVVNEIIDLITGHRQNSSFVPTFERQRRGGCLIGRPSTICWICVWVIFVALYWFGWSAVGRCIYINIRISLCICACFCTSWTVPMYRCKNWGRWCLRPRKSWHRSVHKYQQGYKISTNSNNRVAHQFYEFCWWVANEMTVFAPLYNKNMGTRISKLIYSCQFRKWSLTVSLFWFVPYSRDNNILYVRLIVKVLDSKMTKLSKHCNANVKGRFGI